MTHPFFDLVLRSITEPQTAAQTLLDLRLGREVLWPAFIAVVALTVVLFNLTLYLAPPPQEATLTLPDMPFILALGVGAGLVVGVFSLQYIGRMFGGQGQFAGSLAVMVWIQTLMLIAQVVQIVLLMILPPLGNLFGLVGGIFGVWVFVNFVARLHGFKSLAMVLMAIIGSFFGVALGLAFLLTILSILLGLDIQNV